ncbi:MAG: hypothetical protein KBG83_01670 [Bacteroidetes bacterium]|jgi:hypothetical protein|nr:hypothetical protein [Bacteroidota bacterium]
MSDNTERDNNFIEFHHYWKSKEQGEKISEISSSEISSTMEEEIPQQSKDEPRIFLHRNGDVIESIEFRCPCGKSTIVHLVYDGD